MKRLLAAVIAMSCCVWSSTAAIGADEDSPNFEKHKILQRTSVGTWKIKGSMDGQDVVGEMKGRWAPGKYCVVFSGTFGTPGESEKMDFSGIIGWDASVGKIREQIFFSSGGTGTALFEAAQEGNVLEGKREGVDGEGVKYTESLRFDIGKGRWVGQPTKAVDSDGNVVAEFGEWVFTRVPQVKGAKKKLPSHPQSVQKKID